MKIARKSFILLPAAPDRCRASYTASWGLIPSRLHRVKRMLVNFSQTWTPTSSSSAVGPLGEIRMRPLGESMPSAHWHRRQFSLALISASPTRDRRGGGLFA